MSSLPKRLTTVPLSEDRELGSLYILIVGVPATLHYGSKQWITPRFKHWVEDDAEYISIVDGSYQEIYQILAYGHRHRVLELVRRTHEGWYSIYPSIKRMVGMYRLEFDDYRAHLNHVSSPSGLEESYELSIYRGSAHDPSVPPLLLTSVGQVNEELRKFKLMELDEILLRKLELGVL